VGIGALAMAMTGKGRILYARERSVNSPGREEIGVSEGFRTLNPLGHSQVLCR
jgi:hypothetical protein